MILSKLTYNSPEYFSMIELRNKVLRIPLGLKLTGDDMEKEKDDVFIACLETNQVVGCCILTQLNATEMMLRQMAVREDLQGKNIGQNLLQFAENEAKITGHSSIQLHARQIALGFYKKYGYQIYGEEFTEVGIPHFAMQKNI